MRVTIIPDDNAVYVNGRAILGLDLSDFPPEIHAVQWLDGRGEVEYRGDVTGNRQPNDVINDLTPYQKWVDRHTDAVAQMEATALKAQQDKAAAEATKAIANAAKGVVNVIAS